MVAVSPGPPTGLFTNNLVHLRFPETVGLWEFILSLLSSHLGKKMTYCK